MFNLFKKKKEEKEIPNERVEISVRYSYEWNEDVPEKERNTPEHPSRPFCKKLMELNRLYTRKDIEDISERLGYSVWDRKGGDGCRHRWVSQTVVKKN
jgi:DUF4097 and DUF4098 domain-containing protein YvlB